MPGVTVFSNPPKRRQEKNAITMADYLARYRLTAQPIGSMGWVEVSLRGLKGAEYEEAQGRAWDVSDYGVTTFGTPELKFMPIRKNPAKRATAKPATVAYGNMERKSVKRGGRTVIFELGSVRRRYRGAVGPNNNENMPLVGYYVLAIEDGQPPERKEFDNLTDARRLYSQASSFEHNPRKGSRARPKKNPPAVGRIISKRVLEIRYKHNDDGKWYKHSFKAGTCAALLPNGTVVLYQQDGKPVARDF